MRAREIEAAAQVSHLNAHMERGQVLSSFTKPGTCSPTKFAILNSVPALNRTREGFQDAALGSMPACASTERCCIAVDSGPAFVPAARLKLRLHAADI